MRKMSRDAATKKRVDGLILNGGRKLQDWTQQMRRYVVTLELSPEEFFSDAEPRTVDGSDSILYLRESI